MNNSEFLDKNSVGVVRGKIEKVFATAVENQKNPEGNSAKQYPEIGGAALAGRADGTDIHNTDTAFPDYRQKFETDPVKNSVETILSIGKSLASLREQAANNPRS